MAASVVGFDVGNSTSYIAIAKGGGIETIDNEYSDRCTPSYISFNDKSRVIGVAAKQSAVTNINNTVYNFSRFLGKNYSDPVVQSELPLLPYKVVALDNDQIGIEVMYLNQKHTFTPEQLLSAQLSKLKHITESHTKCPIFDVVINCPSFYTDRERWAILDASRVSGLNCVRLINDTTAIGLAYGLYNQDIPEADKPARNVAFVLMGQSNLQVAVCAFNKGKMKILSTSADACLGGRDLDLAILNQICINFKEKYNLDVKSNHKAMLKLFIECEKLKKLMSANSTSIPLNIECFMEDKDVTSSMKRSEFEDLIAGHLERAEATMASCLEQANLKPEDITFVEMVGGSTRIPSIKALIQKVFKQEGRTTLNADEAIARGCALQAAIISPAFKVKEFSIIDASPYSVTIRYPSSKDENKSEEFEIFPHLNPVPITRQITIKQKKDFIVDAYYTGGKVWNNNKTIGSFKICNVKPQDNNPDIEVKLKFRICGNGTLSISSAQLIEKHEKEELVYPTEEKQPMDVENGNEVIGDSEKMGENTPKEEVNSNEPAVEPKKVKKIVNKTIDVPIEGMNAHLTDAEIQNFTEVEGSMISQEKLQREKDNAKNALEEYIYEMRDKISGSHAEYIVESDREKFSASLTKLEDWLYEDGENASRQAYVDKLEELKSFGNVYQTRYREAQNRPVALNNFNQVYEHYCSIVDSYTKGSEKYNHLTTEEINIVSEVLKEKRKWVDDGIALQNTKKKTDDPVLFTNQIMDQISVLEKKCIPIINKPKPAPPKPEKKESENGKTENGSSENNATHQENGTKNGTQETEANHTMDVD